MRLSKVKSILTKSEYISFQLPDGKLVPSHFHVTEIGLVDKHFIDCGGTVRQEKKINFQLWNAQDYDHRLHPEKLTHIIELSERMLSLPDLEVEVEYQGETIGKFGLDHDGKTFLLTSTATGCLAGDRCGIPASKPKVRLSQIQEKSSCCGSGVC